MRLWRPDTAHLLEILPLSSLTPPALARPAWPRLPWPGPPSRAAGRRESVAAFFQVRDVQFGLAAHERVGVL